MEGLRQGKKIEGLGYRRRKRRTECRIVIIKILIVFCSRRIFLLQRWNFSFFYAAKQTEKRKKKTKIGFGFEKQKDWQRNLDVFGGSFDDMILAAI